MSEDAVRRDCALVEMIDFPTPEKTHGRSCRIAASFLFWTRRPRANSAGAKHRARTLYRKNEHASRRHHVQRPQCPPGIVGRRRQQFGRTGGVAVCGEPWPRAARPTGNRRLEMGRNKRGGHDGRPDEKHRLSTSDCPQYLPSPMQPLEGPAWPPAPLFSSSWGSSLSSK